MMSEKTTEDYLVSIIVCTYNRCDMLIKCLKSILAQSHRNIEIIVIDDASQDDTPTRLASLMETDSRVKYYRNKKNIRVARATNVGFSKSKGEFICLCGDDDIWVDKEKLAKQLSHFLEEPAASKSRLAIVSTYWTETSLAVTNKREPKIPKNMLRHLLKRNGLICGSTVMISRASWLAVGGLDERFSRGTDSELFRSILAHGFTAHIIKEFMVDVNVGEHDRMTPILSNQARWAETDAILKILFKYKLLFLRHPSALAARLYKIIENAWAN